MNYIKSVIILIGMLSISISVNAENLQEQNNTTIIMMPEIPMPIQANKPLDQNITVVQVPKTPKVQAVVSTPTKVIIKLPKTPTIEKK